jgi:thiol-disulfide isomerase/thioredoxin
MPSPSPRLLPAVTLAVCLGVLAQGSRAAETDPDGRLFEPSVDALADVEQALRRADKSDRLGLVVLGANWCHDSRALAARLNKSPLVEVIEEHYELVFVDVGFYTAGRDVVQHYGVPQFYATPTVLIIDPATGKVVDNEERHLWGDAYRVDMESSVDYFEKWAADDTPRETAPDSVELKRLFAEIDQFEQQLAERVAAGYAIVGPMLKADVVDGNPPEGIAERWRELAKFRTSIPSAVKELRTEAMRRVEAGEDEIQLEFPDFPLLSWESG